MTAKKPRQQLPLPLLDRRGRPRTATMMPGTGGLAGRSPANKGKRLPPELLERGEVERLLEGCTDDAPGRRMAAIIAAMYRTGITAGEAREMLVEHYTSGPEASLYIAPGGRQQARTLALDEQSDWYLQRWLQSRSTMPGVHLFCVTRPPTVGNITVDGAFKEALSSLTSRLKTPGRVHLQAFRYTFAAELFTEGWPLFYIQAQLGITGLSSMEDFVRDLGVGRPTQDDVLFAARLRPEWKHGDARRRRAELAKRPSS